MNQQEQKIFELINDLPVAYKPLLAKALKSVTAGLLLSQFLYWTKNKTVKERDGWFYKNEDEICNETGMTIEQQRTARKILTEYYILETEKVGLPAKNWYRLNHKKIIWLVDNYIGTPSTSGGETRPLVVGKPDNILYTEITTENTYKEEEEKEINEYLGFPLPDNWSESCFLESDGSYVAMFTDGMGRRIKQSEINERRKKYVSSLKTKKTKESRSEFAKQAVKALQEAQGIYKLDGGDNLNHAEDVKKHFENHLIKDMQYTPKDEEDLLKQFKFFLNKLVNHHFHGRNATSMGYIARNFNKITRDLNSK